MRMLDALNHPARPAKKSGAVPLLLGAIIAMSLSAALPAASPMQDTGSALTEVLTGGTKAKDTRALVESTNARLRFSKDVTKVAFGNDKILSVPSDGMIDKRQFLLKAGEVGRTTLTVWFSDGTDEQYMFSVTRDLSVLEAALKSVHQSIEASIAPDRDAIVLTGQVPDSTYAARAAAAANDYVSAKTSGSEKSGQGKVINLIRMDEKASNIEQRLKIEIESLSATGVTVRRIQQGPVLDDTKDIFIVGGSVPDVLRLQDAMTLVRAAIGDADGKRVVSQMKATDRPTSIEQVLEKAIHEQVGAKKVKVSRVAQVDTSGDTDVLVLTGTVPTQSALVQTLTLTSKVYQQQEIVKRRRAGQIQRTTETFAGGLTRTTETPLAIDNSVKDIHVAADESGGLIGGVSSGGQFSRGTALSGVFASGTSNRLQSGGDFGALLGNDVTTNLGRAKAIELANGRVLSFLTVEDLPQVRVDIRLYEISRTALLNWDATLNKLGVADFDTNGIDPNRVSRVGTGGTILTNANGEPILGHSNTDIAGVVSFLEGGFTNSLQIGGGRFALDALFTLLETEGVARSIASPSLTVLSGEIAAFGDGGSVSVRNSITTNVGINDSVGVFSSVQQISFGIQLAVRPLVDEKGYITLDVLPSVSNPDFQTTQLVRQATGTPQETTAFAQRSMRTSARLRDGDTLLIGGLASHSRMDNSGRTPGLASIPLLGWLFQDKRFEDKDRELVIALNPSIMRDKIDAVRLWAFPDSSELLPRPTVKPPANAPSSAQQSEKP